MAQRPPQIILVPFWMKATVALIAIAVSVHLGMNIANTNVTNKVIVVVGDASKSEVAPIERMIPPIALGTIPPIMTMFRCVPDPGEGRRSKRQRGTGR